MDSDLKLLKEHLDTKLLDNVENSKNRALRQISSLVDGLNKLEIKYEEYSQLLNSLNGELTSEERLKVQQKLEELYLSISHIEWVLTGTLYK